MVVDIIDEYGLYPTQNNMMALSNMFMKSLAIMGFDGLTNDLEQIVQPLNC